MKKKIIIIVVLVIFLVGGVGAFVIQQRNAAKEPITIAVAEIKPGTKDQPETDSFFAGALMAAEEINKAGGIDGARIQIEPYTDGNDPAKAKKNAQLIVKSNAVAVIGHSTAESSIAAAPLYQKAQLPALIASPIRTDAIQDFPDYFNISYTSEQQGAYLANYAIRVLKRNKVMIVIDEEDTSNNTLAKKFENTFQGLGGAIELLYIEKETSGSKLQTVEVEKISGKIFSAQDSLGNDLLLIAASPSASASIIVELKNHGFKRPILGGDNLSSQTFRQEIKNQRIEEVRPGYFTDGIITTRALFIDNVNEFSTQFVSDYKDRYQVENLSNAAAHGYDAALVIFHAIKISLADGKSVVSRESIVNALQGMNDSKKAFSGVTGSLYFDHNRMAGSRHPLLGIYQYGQLIAAPIQYTPISIPENIPDLDNRINKEHVIVLDGYYVYVTHTVYAGMDIIELSNLDQKTSSYHADFYLWFRYIPNKSQPEFLPEDYTFTNAESDPDVKLVGTDLTSDGYVYKTYRVSGQFKNEFHFQAYPFDRQDLAFQFRNQGAESSFIQYVVDRPGMKYLSDNGPSGAKADPTLSFKPLDGWKTTSVGASQSILSTSSTLGNPFNFNKVTATDFSIFDFHVFLERNALAVVIKSLLPLLITLILAYITFFLPVGNSERLGVASTALLTTAFFHLSFADTLPSVGYTVAMEYFFYAAYIVCAVIVFLETISMRLEKKENGEQDEIKKANYQKRREQLSVVGRIVYPSIIGFVIIMGIFNYVGWIDLNPKNSEYRTAMESFMAYQNIPFEETNDSNVVETKKVNLTLATWRPEDNTNINSLLQLFHQKNPDITVTHVPTNGDSYDNILSQTLENGDGPDMFFLRPFDRTNEAFTLDLSSLPIEEKYEQSLRIPWQGTNGNYFGLPAVGVIQGIYYNKDIFDKLGIAIPTTWEEFLQAAETIKQSGKTPIGNSLTRDEENDIFMNVATNAIGGPKGRNSYNVDGGRCFNDANAVQAFQSILDIVPYLPSDFREISSYTSKQRFINQDAVMLFGGSWDVGYFTDNVKFDWGVFAVPAPKGSTTYVIFQPDIAIGVNKNVPSTHQKAALRFLQWLMTDESIKGTLEELPGFYPLISSDLKLLDDKHSAEFQRLKTNNPIDLRWAYSELSVTNQLPSPGNLMQQAQYHMIANHLTAQQAADELQAGLAQWYEPAQTCKK